MIDLRHLALARETVLVLRGDATTDLLIRVARTLRNGPESTMILEGMTSDQVLFVATGRLGGRPRVARASTWRGSIMATEREVGILLGANTYTEGGVYGKRILVKGPNTTVQHYPWRGNMGVHP